MTPAPPIGSKPAMVRITGSAGIGAGGMEGLPPGWLWPKLYGGWRIQETDVNPEGAYSDTNAIPLIPGGSETRQPGRLLCFQVVNPEYHPRPTEKRCEKL